MSRGGRVNRVWPWSSSLAWHMETERFRQVKLRCLWSRPMLTPGAPSHTVFCHQDLASTCGGAGPGGCWMLGAATPTGCSLRSGAEALPPSKTPDPAQAPRSRGKGPEGRC